MNKIHDFLAYVRQLFVSQIERANISFQLSDKKEDFVFEKHKILLNFHLTSIIFHTLDAGLWTPDEP